MSKGIICDKCGEISKETHEISTTTGYCFKRKRVYDLCLDCYLEFFKWLNPEHPDYYLSLPPKPSEEFPKQ